MTDPPVRIQEPIIIADEVFLRPEELRARLADALATVAVYRGLIRLAERISAKRGRAVPIPLCNRKERKEVGR